MRFFESVALLGFTLGLCNGWTSPFIPKLTSADSELPITEAEASWIASLLQLGRVCGAVIGSIETTYLGSKFSALSSAIPIVVSWIFLIIADSVGWIYAARSLQGIATGMFFSTFPLYAGEISNPSIRGAVIGLVMNSGAIGSIIGNLIGTLTANWLFSCISLVPTVAYVFLFALLPSSPYYLVSRDRLDEAAKAIVWYRRDADVDTELESIKQFVAAERSATFRDRLRELNVPRNRKALLMVNAVFMLLQVGGTYTIAYYMETILRRAGVATVMDPGMAVVVIGVIGVMGGFFAMYANDKFGRKAVLGGSAFGLSLSFLVLGIQFVLVDNGYASPGLEWLAIIDIATLEFLMCLGIGPVPSTLISELFPPRVKSFAACTANMTSGLFAFISTKTYQPMTEVMPDQYVLWCYGVMMCVLAIFTIITLPETKGKSLQEIQDMLERKHKR